MLNALEGRAFSVRRKGLRAKKVRPGWHTVLHKARHEQYMICLDQRYPRYADLRESRS